MKANFLEQCKGLDEAFDAIAARIDEGDLQIQDLEKAFAGLRNTVKQAMNSGAYGKNNAGVGLFADTKTAKDFGLALLDVASKGFTDIFVESGRKAMGTSGSSGGGFIVPETILQVMIDLMGNYGKFRQNATVVPGIGYRTTIPNLAALPDVYAPGEGKTITESQPRLTSIGFDPIKLAILTAFSRELEEDAIVGVAELVIRAMTKSMARAEDQCGFVGNGTDSYYKFVGIVHALRSVDANLANIPGLWEQSTAGLYSAIDLDDFDEIVGRLPEQFDDNAKWYTTKRFFHKVMYSLARAAGANDLSTILSSQKAKYFMGYEVVFVPFMPYNLETAHIPVVLGDLQAGAYLGEARQITIDTSRDVLFKEDMTAIKATERISINVAPGVGTTTEAGPIVGLITKPS